MSHLSERRLISLVSPPLNLLFPLLFLDMAYPGLHVSRDTMWRGVSVANNRANVLNAEWPQVRSRTKPSFVPLTCLWKGRWGSCQPKAEVSCARVMVDLGIWNQSVVLEPSGDSVEEQLWKNLRNIQGPWLQLPWIRDPPPQTNLISVHSPVLVPIWTSLLCSPHFLYPFP